MRINTLLIFTILLSSASLAMAVDMPSTLAKKHKMELSELKAKQTTEMIACFKGLNISPVRVPNYGKDPKTSEIKVMQDMELLNKRLREVQWNIKRYDDLKDKTNRPQLEDIHNELMSMSNEGTFDSLYTKYKLGK